MTARQQQENQVFLVAGGVGFVVFVGCLFAGWNVPATMSFGWFAYWVGVVSGRTGGHVWRAMRGEG